MFTLKDYQEKAVTTMLEHTIDALGEVGLRRIPVLLKAPTGSGKTVSVGTYVSRLVDQVRLMPGGHAKELAFIWLAPNTLHLQSYDALKAAYDQSRKLTTIKLETLSDTFLNPNEILFINWGALNKDSNSFIRNNEQSHTLENLVLNTRARGVEIIVIIDEAHLSADTGEKAQKVLAKINAKVELSVTATPITRPDRMVVIPRKEVVAAEMIKKGIRINPDVSPQELNGDNVNIYLLRKALAMRDQLEEQYIKEGESINPLLLIQLPSDESKMTSLDNTIRQQIVTALEHNHKMTVQNSQVAVWLSGERENLEKIEVPTAGQKVLIFKQAIAQGWDCPRAAILLIFRETKSETFGIQTVGRILRMPKQKHYLTDDLNYGYVFTNLQADKIKFIPDDQDYFEVNMATRRADVIFDTIPGQVLVNNRPTIGFINRLRFEPIFNKVASEKFGIQQLPKLSVTSDPKTIEEAASLAASNKATMATYFWNLDAKKLTISIPHDVYVDQYEENIVILEHAKRATFPLDFNTIDQMMDRLCYGSITKLNKAKSWKNLKATFIHFFEYFFMINEMDTRRIVVSNENRSLVLGLIDDTLAAYDVWQKQEGNKNRRPLDIEWEMPEKRFYPANFNQMDDQLHSLQPLFSSPERSRPETDFEALLSGWNDHINWWYKNGDKGQEHYAIIYEPNPGERQLFFVDYIISFKDNTIGLFDTKTLGSDPLAMQKHNALISWCQDKSAAGDQKYIGSLIFHETRTDSPTFKVSANPVLSEIKDLVGWTNFSPSTSQMGF